jgi:hypothetical protein
MNRSSSDDEWAALAWLLRGKDNPGALIRLLNSGVPLDGDIRHALACALRPIGSSGMKLFLMRRRGRGRPPKGVAGAIETLNLAEAVQTAEREGRKPSAALEDLAKKRKRSRATLYSAKRAARIAKKVK